MSCADGSRPNDRRGQIGSKGIALHRNCTNSVIGCCATLAIICLSGCCVKSLTVPTEFAPDGSIVVTTSLEFSTPAECKLSRLLSKAYDSFDDEFRACDASPDPVECRHSAALKWKPYIEQMLVWYNELQGKGPTDANDVLENAKSATKQYRSRAQ
jgi:hypothetical protein